MPVYFSCVPSTQAQQPRFVLNTGGPSTTVRALVFSPDSTRVYSAGSDKVVRVWGVRGAEEGRGLGAELEQKLRWEIARGHRGYLQALAVSPDGRLLAAGGMSARGSSGDIPIFDTTTGGLLRSAAEEGEKEKEDQAGAPGRGLVLRGHRQTIVSLDFSPDGKHLLSISKDGEARLWTLPEGFSVVLRKAQGFVADPQPGRFLSAERLVVPFRHESGWYLALYNATGKYLRSLGTPHQGRVTALAVEEPGGTWASADASGAVFLWEGADARRGELLRRDRVAHSLSFGEPGTLFVSTYRDARGQAVLEMWDTRNRQLVAQALTAEGEHNYTCAASRDGRFVVTYAHDENELYLFALKDAAGNPVDNPLGAGTLVELRGSGEKIWQVAFDRAGTYKIGIGTEMLPVAEWTEPLSEGIPPDYGRLNHLFDLTAPGLQDIEPHEVGFRTPDSAAGPWSVRFSEAGETVFLYRDREYQGRIWLDPVFQGPARSHCFLADEDGITYGIAIGTELQHGVFVYGLPRGDRRAPLLRYFRDHTGWVTSLSQSSDGKYLASAATDQTIKIWSLAGILAPGRAFARENAWGCVFTPVAGGLRVSAILRPSIATRRELELGDVIAKVYFPAGPNSKQFLQTTDPRRMLQALEEVQLWQQPVLFIRGEARPIQLVPAWEPLVSLFVDQDGQWAMWTPQGYYDSSVIGDELFGWQINRGVDRDPRFFRADQFRGDLERPAVIRGLLEAGSLPEALAATGSPVPNDVERRAVALSVDVPEVTLLAPLHNQRIGKGDTVDVIAEVNFPDRAMIEQFALRCYINGIPAPEPIRTIDGKIGSYRWSAAPPNRHNRVRVVAEHRERPEENVYDFADVFVQANPDPKKLRLHLVTIAADEYAGSLKLNYCVADARTVADAVAERAGGQYEIAGNPLRLENKATQHDNVENAFAELSERLADARPEDILLIYMAGHGVDIEGQYYFVAPHPQLTAFDESLIKKHGVSWQLLQRLAPLPCRKVFMLDTCYSGLTVKGMTASEEKAAIRPLRRTQALVLTAAAADEESWEDDSLKHGIFTHCIVQGLKGQADGHVQSRRWQRRRDGTVDMLELVQYVATQVPIEAKERKGVQQTPQSSETDLGFVPLVKVE